MSDFTKLVKSLSLTGLRAIANAAGIKYEKTDRKPDLLKILTPFIGALESDEKVKAIAKKKEEESKERGEKMKIINSQKRDIAAWLKALTVGSIFRAHVSPYKGHVQSSDGEIDPQYYRIGLMDFQVKEMSEEKIVATLMTETDEFDVTEFVFEKLVEKRISPIPEYKAVYHNKVIAQISLPGDWRLRDPATL